MKASILFLALCLIPAFSIGSHKVAGVELTYERKSSGKYDVFMHVIRHCDGAAAPAKDLTVQCSTTTITVTASQQTLISNKKLNDCQSSPCNGIGNYEELIWKAEIDLSASFCCEWKLKYSNDYRQNYGFSGPYYVEALINKCADVSGGRFVQLPEITLRHHNNQRLNFGYESYDSADSVTYELIPALVAQGQAIGYSGTYTYLRPLTFFGYPNQNLQWPAGFRVSPNGEVQFRPTQLNGVGTIALEAKIWKWVNGQRQVVGTAVRDIEVLVLNPMPPNAAPTMNLLSLTLDTLKVFFCAGDTAPVIWQSTDADNDSTFIDILYSDPDIQLSTDYTHGKQVRLGARIASTLADTASMKVRYLHFRVKDRSCPLPAWNIYTLALRPAKKPTAQFSQNQQCRQLATSIQVSDSVNANFRSWYYFYNNQHQLIGSSLNGLFNTTNLPLGVSYLDMAYGFQGSCSFDTSITLNTLQDFKFAFSSPNTACQGDSLKLELIDQGTAGSYTYQWSNLTTPTTPYLIDSQEVAWVFPPDYAMYEVKAIDTAGCFLTYTKNVTMVMPPQYSMDQTVFVCPGNSAQIGPYTITYSNFKIWTDGETDFPRTETKEGWYSFVASYYNLCEVRDSVYLEHFTPPSLVGLPADTNFCKNESLYFTASNGGRPYTFYWNGIITNTPRNVTQTEFVKLSVMDKNGCRDSAGLQVWVSEQPNLSFLPGANIELCPEDSVELKVFNVPQKSLLMWSDSTGSDTRIIYPGFYWLTLIDSVGCVFNYPVTAPEWATPDAGFSYMTQTGGIAFTPDVLNVNHMWFFGDGNTSNTGLPVHNYVTPGNYLVKHFVSDPEHDCKATDSLEIVVLTLSELEKAGIDVFPNPFNGSFTVRYAAGPEVYSVQLFDMQGRRIAVQTEAAFDQLIVSGLDALATGTYILKIFSDKGPIETRLQKD